MRPLPQSTRIRIIYECSIKEGIKLAIQSVMHQSVSHARFVDVTRFWVADLEMLVSTVAIGTCSEVVMQIEYIVHQMPFKFLHVNALALPSHELPPSGEEIFNRDDILVCMSESDSLKRPPPEALAGLGTN